MCGFAPDPAQKIGADFIVTAAPVYQPLAELRGGERFPKGAQLLLVHEGKAEPLVTGFAATADANVSFDGKLVLFAGKQAAGDPWQIWEVTLADRSVRKVIATADGRRAPALSARRADGLGAAHGAADFNWSPRKTAIRMKCIPLNPTAGPGVLPLTYLQTSAFPTDVLQDGRILFEAGFPLGSGSTPELYLVYADGSGVESYRCDHGRARWGGTQLASGDVVFTHGASLARFTSPLAHEEQVAAPHAEYAGAIAETAAGEWLVSARAAAERITRSSCGSRARRRCRPCWPRAARILSSRCWWRRALGRKRHPSGLHPWDYANLLALDARLSREGDLKRHACIGAAGRRRTRRATRL